MKRDEGNVARPPSWRTAHPEVNAALSVLQQSIQAILGSRFAGMYLYGSLALGGFDPQGSDIDFLVATTGELPGELFDALSAMHQRFDESGSPWARRVEAAYIPVEVLWNGGAASSKYPQIEKDQRLALLPLEVGWPYQFHTVREHGVVIAGPDPRELIATVAPAAMRGAAAAIVDDWVNLSLGDAEWLAWVHDRSGQAFVVLTLCRLLYSLETGSVGSKPDAARWAGQGPARQWAALIERSLAMQYRHDPVPESDAEATLALLAYAEAELCR